MSPEDLSPVIRNAVVSLRDAGFDVHNHGVDSELPFAPAGPWISMYPLFESEIHDLGFDLAEHFGNLGATPLVAFVRPVSGAPRFVMLFGDCLLNLRYTPEE